LNKLKPEHVEADNNLAGILIRVGRPQEAIRNLNEASRLNSNFARAHLNGAKADAQTAAPPKPSPRDWPARQQLRNGRKNCCAPIAPAAGATDVASLTELDRPVHSRIPGGVAQLVRAAES
jgi:hypothetical protein